MSRWLRANFSTVALTVVLLVFSAISVWLLAPVLAVPSDPNTGVPTFSAALAFTGALVTAGVALVGIILEQSRAASAARLAEAADARAALEQRRLQMQAALETIKLLNTSEGKTAPPVQVSAALMVLSKLGETRLAIDLAAEFWSNSQVSASAIVYLCDAAFLGEEDSTQVAAAVLLSTNWSALQASDERIHWLSFTDQWPGSLCSEARALLAKTLQEWIDQTPADGPDFRMRLVAEARRLSGRAGQEPLSAGLMVIES